MSNFVKLVYVLLVVIFILLGSIFVSSETLKISQSNAPIVILDANFDSGVDSFTYTDDTFRNTNQPLYADGERVENDQVGGALSISLGGIDNDDIEGISGGWQHLFTLTETAQVTLRFDFMATHGADFESDEFSQIMASIDGVAITTNSGDFIVQLTGDGNGGEPISTGRQSFQVVVGILDAGEHLLTIGGFNNKKTFNNETSEIIVDNVKLEALFGVDQRVLLQARFDQDDGGFIYTDDAFKNTFKPVYADGLLLPEGGLNGGALQITLGGVDAREIVNMSGGWQRTIVLDQPTNAILSFRFNLTQTAAYESDEFSQVLVAINDRLIGVAGRDHIKQINGNDNDDLEETTGWRLAEADLGMLSAGEHKLSIGGFNNEKTAINEVTTILIDELTVVKPSLIPAAEVAQQLVEGLDFERFKNNIKTLAGFGDRSQLTAEGSTSYDQAVAWLSEQLTAAGYQVDSHPYQFRGDDRQSIFVTKVGKLFPDRMYIVSAHLDGRGGGGAADDDGSGVSLVLEAARSLANFDTDSSVRFIFWNNEESGLNGSTAYANDRVLRQGIEQPAGSGMFPEPTWLGIVQHDMILFDHGLPPQTNQIVDADIDIEFREFDDELPTAFAVESAALATALNGGNNRYSSHSVFSAPDPRANGYPAQVTNNMSNTDSMPFRNFAPSISVRENRRLAEIGRGANPNWHQPTDIFTTYSQADFSLGFNTLQMTLGTIAERAGVQQER